MNSLVFDIGGSLLRAGLWNAASERLLARAEMPSPGLDQNATEDPLERLLGALRRLAEQLIEAGDAPLAIGIAFPGPVDALGRVGQAPTLWGERGPEPIDLAAMVSSALWDRPTLLANDLTAAGMRYASPGQDFCIVTVSSGIGNKLFLDGRPVLGEQHRGGEIGHWRVDPSPTAPLCECGGRGHLGALASGRSLAHHFSVVSTCEAELLASSSLSYLSSADAVSNAEVARAFREGDPFAELLIRACAQPLGVALASLHLAIGIERFVIVGGGAAALGPNYLNEVAKSAAESSWGPDELWPARIEAGLDDDDSGLIGMGRLLSLKRS